MTQLTSSVFLIVTFGSYQSLRACFTRRTNWSMIKKSLDQPHTRCNWRHLWITTLEHWDIWPVAWAEHGRNDPLDALFWLEAQLGTGRRGYTYEKSNWRRSWRIST